MSFRRRLLRRRLFWIGVLMVVTLLWLVAQAVLAASALVTALRRLAGRNTAEPGVTRPAPFL